MIEVHSVALESLIHDGYAVLTPGILLNELLRAFTHARRDSAEVPIDPNGGLPWAYDLFADDYPTLTHHAAELMRSLGATNSAVTRVTMIKKRPSEGRRYWHNDEGDWMPVPDRKTAPKDVLVLYYLTPTDKGSGCLVVRPRFVLGPTHNEHNSQYMPDEVQVPVSLGDVVLMD